MAEIRIEQKRRSLAWLWVLLVLLVLAAVAWYLYYDRGMRVSAQSSPAAAHVVQAATGFPGITLAYAPTRHARRRAAA